MFGPIMGFIGGHVNKVAQTDQSWPRYFHFKLGQGAMWFNESWVRRILISCQTSHCDQFTMRRVVLTINVPRYLLRTEPLLLQHHQEHEITSCLLFRWTVPPHSLCFCLTPTISLILRFLDSCFMYSPFIWWIQRITAEFHETLNCQLKFDL